jgi:hypothetical protein
MAVAAGARALALAVSTLVAQSSPPDGHLLNVPYLPQSEALCGGAAAAMVMRYWGAAGIQPDAFASLIDPEAHGIPTAALVASLRRQSWTVIAGPADAPRAQRQLAQGRPVIALLEDRPGAFHYVVVVAWMGRSVIVHDPARMPFRVLDERTFDRAWEKSRRWMLVAFPPASLPAHASAEHDRAPTAASTRGDVCTDLVAEGVRVAQTGDRESARRALEAATVTCPAAAGPWRELAGLDALAADWTAAADHARRALAREEADDYTWRLLATSEYVRHEDLAALRAWNRIGEPTVDIVNIHGLERTRFPVLTTAMAMPPGTLVTPERLRLAERRARAIPSIAAARVSFHPVENGRAQVDVGVVERSPAPTSKLVWIGTGLRAGTDRELSASLANMTGGGDRATASWRWWEHRPRVEVSMAAPGPRGVGGVWRVEGSWEKETFGSAAFADTRTHAGLSLDKWITARVRVEGGVALDRYESVGLAAAASGAIELWPMPNLALQGRSTFWSGEMAPFASSGVAARWRSSSKSLGPVWLASAGFDRASGSAPAMLWPGADTGHARDALLRAHPLLDEGVITGGVFGRELTHATVEWQRWRRLSRWPFRVAPAAFVDAAHAARGLAFTDSRLQVDVGAGLRISAGEFGVLRIDLGKGLRDGSTALSVGWQR